MKKFISHILGLTILFNFGLTPLPHTVFAQETAMNMQEKVQKVVANPESYGENTRSDSSCNSIKSEDPCYWQKCNNSSTERTMIYQEIKNNTGKKTFYYHPQNVHGILSIYSKQLEQKTFSPEPTSSLTGLLTVRQNK